MTSLPILRVEDEKAMVADVTTWTDVIRTKITASASREWLETALRQFLRPGLIETLRVVESADGGDEIADAALATRGC